MKRRRRREPDSLCGRSGSRTRGRLFTGLVVAGQTSPFVWATVAAAASVLLTDDGLGTIVGGAAPHKEAVPFMTKTSARDELELLLSL